MQTPGDANAVYVSTSGNVGIGDTTPNSKLQVAGPIATAVALPTSGPYTVTASDSVIIPCFVGDVDLPTAVGITGRQYTIKRPHDCGAPGAVTVDPYSTQTIDGAATFDLESDGEYITIVSDGDEWHIIAEDDIAD